MFAQADPLHGKINPLLPDFMKTFYALTVVGNIIPTGLMVYNLWMTHHKSSNSGAATPKILFPILKILVESASLQLIVEMVLLVLFASGRQEQFMIFGLVTPIVGITFNLITIRIKLVSYGTGGGRASTYPSNHSNQLRYENNQLHTIGSLPARRVDIWHHDEHERTGSEGYK
ncbi:hypothetical protein V5O48_007312 [Marasmius crinis-equi]|uniref:Uncharacterized protein n=1 Tax=Marasmius crinis-equi TaxID=585013 RepID=A0ABR3FHS0_9AGAR